jgi:hypothetical protein
MNNDIRPIINDVLETIIHNIKDKKAVSFNEYHNTIFIIESIDDKEYYSNKNDIWWSSVDYIYFRIISKHEILHLIQNYNNNNSNLNLSVKDAIRLLYQP